MTSKENDTLPIPGFSQEFSVDVTADEDFIPTSQPQGSDGSKVSRNSETSSDRSAKELDCLTDTNCSAIDDTLPREAVIDQSTCLDKDKSADFILDTETKKIKITYPKDDVSCKKKLPIFSEGVPQTHSHPLWETPQLSEGLPLDNQNFSILNDSPVDAQQPDPGTKSENLSSSITEIIVNDSSDTVDLEGSLVKGVQPEEEVKTEGKLSGFMSDGSDVARCEETQVFDNSSILLLEPPSCSMIDQSEKSIKETASQNAYLVKTVEDNESDPQVNLTISECSPLGVGETSGKFDVKKEAVAPPKENGVSKKEVQSTAPIKDPNSVTRTMDFTFTITCFFTYNTKTNKVSDKFITKVKEFTKVKPKIVQVERLSNDTTSDKSKRYSTSSSGSVYSDKLGLPFALPKRLSIVSDHTDSSEEDIGINTWQKERSALGRTPWGNEYLVPLKLDELLQIAIDNHQFLDRPVGPPERPKTRRSFGRSKLTVQSSSSSEPMSNCELNGEESLAKSSEDAPGKETTEMESSPPHEENKEDENPVESEEEHVEDNNEEKAAPETVAEAVPASEPVTEVPNPPEEEGSVTLREGLPVLARWTDKRYYSGVLCGSDRNNRWEVKFDDGMVKMVRDDFILPKEWLKVGALVFALVEDKYMSGQITDIQRGEEETYAVELDAEKKKVFANVSDLRLTDVMAGIVREKYKPLPETPKAKGDIDFDNVLSGKRLREHRTPVRPSPTVSAGSSGAKKKSSSSKTKKPLDTIKETPELGSTGRRAAALKSEGGHLVEDKIISTDSPSGNEVGGTPVRRTSKETRGKSKPRALSYEAEESRSTGKKSQNWLAPDGTPIPGPSGLKFRRRKPKPGTDDVDEPPKKKSEQEKTSRGTKSAKKSPAAPEKSQKKRKLEDSIEETRSGKRGDTRGKTKSRKV